MTIEEVQESAVQVARTNVSSNKLREQAHALAQSAPYNSELRTRKGRVSIEALQQLLVAERSVLGLTYHRAQWAVKFVVYFAHALQTQAEELSRLR